MGARSGALINKIFHFSIRSADSPPALCSACGGRPRRSFSCCGQTLCADCLFDHAGENRQHPPPLSDEILALSLISEHATADRLNKMVWLLTESGGKSWSEKTDAEQMEAIANIGEIEFTICQKCGRSLRRFFCKEGKVLCADCWLDELRDLGHTLTTTAGAGHSTAPCAGSTGIGSPASRRSST